MGRLERPVLIRMDHAGVMMRAPGRLRALGIVAVLLAVGQLLLAAVAPLTRANGTFASAAGPAILVPDSEFYLHVLALSELLTLPWTRSGYPLLIALGAMQFEPELVAVTVNALALLSGGYVLFRVTEARAGLPAAVIAATVLVTNPMTAQWLRIVTTEAVFFGTVAVIAGLSVQVLDGSARWPDRSVLLLSALLAAVTRPNGFLVAMSTLLLMASAGRPGTRRRVAIATVALATAILLPAAYTATGPPAEGSIAQQLYAGVVVEGAEHVRTTVTMPLPADPEDPTFEAAARYALSHPGATAKLALARLAVETVQVRRHYPTVVNAAFAIAMLVLACAVAAGWSDPRARRSRTAFLVIGVPLMLLTMATFAVPEGRYGWAYLLPLAPIAGIGADRAIVRLRTSRPLDAHVPSEEP